TVEAPHLPGFPATVAELDSTPLARPRLQAPEEQWTSAASSGITPPRLALLLSSQFQRERATNSSEPPIDLDQAATLSSRYQLPPESPEAQVHNGLFQRENRGRSP